ncbi:MAG: hypothetical protein FWD21_02295 [Peptococcaceae bacterium]|nr:hypothetical protein [Peptococcaceae bacterium]
MSENDSATENKSSEWCVVLVLTEFGQRVAISQDNDFDGQVLCTAASKEEAVEQAVNLSRLTNMPLYNSEVDTE